MSEYDIDHRGCWIWNGRTDPHGYGVARGGKKAHRVYFAQATGEDIPKGWHVHHRCEVKACVNPDHLEALPASLHQRGHAVLNRPLTDAQRADIREMARDHTIPWRVMMAKYGISQTYVENIIAGRRFNEAGDEPVRPDPRDCVFCGKPIAEDRRRHVRYCDNDCRQRAYRQNRGQKLRPHTWKRAA
jgi:predicted nucleic acid-binding Zn ribbon protein